MNPKNLRKAVALAALTLAAAASQAEITIGVSMPLTGPASSLGIPMQNQFKLWPVKIGGETIKMVILDDATDPAKGAQNAQRFIADKVDIVAGSIVTPIAAAMAQSLNEAGIPQYAFGPFPPVEGKDRWSFRFVPGMDVMSRPIVEHMKKTGVKTVGFLGYSDAYGEGWLQQLEKDLTAAGIKMMGVERFARSDQSVAAQSLKLVAGNPDAIFIAASGGGGAMPHSAVIERGFKGKIYQSHAVVSQAFLKLGGKALEGSYAVASPSVVAEQLPASNPSRTAAAAFVKSYEGAYGAGTRAIFSASGYDLQLVLEAIIPKALKVAKPGTQAFREALRNETEKLGALPVANGVTNFSATNHWAYSTDSAILLKVVNNDWKLEP